MPEVPQDDGLSRSAGTSGSPPSPPASISIVKNRSTGNLLAQSALALSTGRTRYSADAGRPADYDQMLKSPILPETEHGLGVSGLRRIRQQPLSRVSTMPPSPESSFLAPPRAASMTLNTAQSRTFTPGGPASPTINFSEDLMRFPSESLHSFSFAHQSEDFLHNRQSVVAKSIDFMRDQSGWAAKHPGLMNAQARVNGDLEMQSMMALLSRANLLNQNDAAGSHGLGPLTGPAHLDSNNVFEVEFAPRSGSQEASSSERLPSSETDADRSKEASPEFPPRVTAEERPLCKGPQAPTARAGMKRTYTDIASLTLQTKLVDALAHPYTSREDAKDANALSPSTIPSFGRPLYVAPSTNHGTKWAPAAQAIFTTEPKAPWTILAANDLACLVFGVTRAEIKKLGILEVVREDRRQWLEEKLACPGSEAVAKARASASKSRKPSASSSTSMAMRGGITALLLSKPSSRQTAVRRAQTDNGSGSSQDKSKARKIGPNHVPTKSRGVLLCGDVLPIQKRNGATGSASLWVKEKKGALIWVVEEIVEDTAYLTLDETGKILSSSGTTEIIWGEHASIVRTEAKRLLPRLPMTLKTPREVDYDGINRIGLFTARNPDGYNVPVSITAKASLGELRVSSFPHIAGILVLSSKTLQITSSNSVFSAALFGQNNADGMHITELIPQFTKLLDILMDEDEVDLVDGIVVPEHSFRRARALLALREGHADAAAMFMRPSGISAKHHDGSELHVDVQMRVVQSDPVASASEVAVIDERSENSGSEDEDDSSQSAVVFALWVTYSRNLHSSTHPGGPASPLISRPGTPPRQPSPGQSISIIDHPHPDDFKPGSPQSLLAQQIKEAASEPISSNPRQQPAMEIKAVPPAIVEPEKAKAIADFAIIEEMGQGAYGQVKFAKYKKAPGNKVVLKFVTKKRILLDTWTRDRRLGTVPLEIHVLDYLRRDGLKHPNIVEMTGFFEDSVNYYIEMVPHGLPGMDLFDYIEMRSTMEEAECKNIFLQVVAALHHLHTKALVVHRDIKDENIILDGDNQVKLIDFGSAAYIKNGPFDVFVGTIDYAAPEVLQGRSYGGKEQDVWALGILLYTLVYKENPFYSVDEILDHELRVPWVMSEGSIDLIRAMLNRDVAARLAIDQVLAHPWCKEEKAT